MPENTVYVGRPTRWGNPFRVVKEGGVWWIVENGRYWEVQSKKDVAIERSIELFTHWFEGQLLAGNISIDPLIGKDLACFCKEGQKCHADVLISFCNEKIEEDAALENAFFGTVGMQIAERLCSEKL